MTSTYQRVAIIDMGTNTFHLLLAELNDEKTYSILETQKIAVRIGEGGISNSNITNEAQQRGLDVLKKYRQKIADSNIDFEAAYATSALRSATNAEEFLEKIRVETGFEPKIIDGNQEAEFIYLGVKSGMKLSKELNLIMDIGGGSVEFIIADKDKICWCQSFEIGAQRLKDKFHTQDPIPEGQLSKLEKYLDRELVPLQGAMKKYNPNILIGVSGSFDTLSDIYDNRNNMENDITVEAFEDIRKELTEKSLQERIDTPGMVAFRAKMIVVALSLIHWLLKQSSFKEIRISRYSLKEGILYSMTKNS